MSTIVDLELDHEEPKAACDAVVAEPISTGVRIVDLAAGACRWPVGEITIGVHIFCGEPARLGRPYCAGHARLAYRAAERPRVRKEEPR